MQKLTNRFSSYAAYTLILTLTMGLPMLPFYSLGVLAPTFIEEFCIDKSVLGLMTMATFACAAILSLWAGNIINYLGAKKSLVVIFSGVFISYSLLIVFRSFYGMMIALLFCGISQSLTNPLTNMMITQRVEPRFKSIVVGIKQSGIQLITLLAGLCIPIIMIKYSWQFTFILLLPILVMLILLAPKIALPNDASATLTLHFFKPNKLLSLLILTQLLVGITVSAFVTYLGLFAVSLGVTTATTGLLISLFGLMGMLSRICITTAVDKIKDETVLLSLLISAAIIVLMVLMLANHQRHWPLWFGAFGMGSTVVVCNAIAMSILLRDERFGLSVNSSGLLSSGFLAGFMVGPALFGLIQTTQLGFYAGWLMLIIILVMALSVSIILYRTSKKLTH